MESEDLASKFAMLTGASPVEVNTYLEMCNWDIERAVNMYIENDSERGIDETSSRGGMDVPEVVGRAARLSRRRPKNRNVNGETNSESSDTREDDIRAPIPQRTEVLVDEPLYTLSSLQRQRSSRIPSSAFRQPSQSWRVQPSPQERPAAGENSAYTPIIIDSDDGEEVTTSSSGTRRRAKKRNLVELFSPPYELIHQGPFDSARDNGTSENKWVLVDIQNSEEFRCQCLNRDLWKNETVAGVLKANFIFWQVNINDPMGQRFQQFYPVSDLPFVGLVDPTTGELLQTFKRLSSPEEFIEDIWEFLSKNPNPTCNNLTIGPAPKRMRREEESGSGEGRIVDKVNDMKITETNLSEMSEAEQLQVAMERSREQFMNTPSSSNYTSPPSESVGQLTDSDTTDSLPTARDNSPIGPTPSLDDDDRSAAACELEETIRHAHNPARVCHLVVRLPQGERQTVTLPASAPIRALKLFAESRGYSMESNELVALYPTRNLSQMKAFASLESAKLYPKDTVFVQEK